MVFSPDFEVLEAKDSYVFKADLPGLRESDVNIALSGNRLTVSGKRDQEEVDKNENYFAAERSYGAFSRSFTLPQGADVDHVRADLKDGVLTIYIPKHPESQPRKIEIGTTGRQGQKAHA
jgi:HSP20 family protein